MRKQLLTIHRWLGLGFGLLISLACLTGAAMVFQTEILRCLNGDLYHLEVPAGGKPLADAELARRVLQQIGTDQTVTFIAVNDEPGAPAEVNLAGMGQKNLLVHPCTGQVLGYPRYTAFFDTVKGLHRWLLNRPHNHQQGTLSAGRVVMGCTALAMAVLLLTGLYLWWPRTLSMLRHRLTVKTGRGLRRFVYDSHVSLGVWAGAFLFLMAATGPTWSFSWYKSAVQTALGMTEEEHRVDQHHGHAAPMQAHPAGEAPRTQQPEEVNVMHFTPQQMQRHGGFHMAMSSLHFGRWGGLTSKVLYLLAALIGATLPWSGYYMWWKRRRHGRPHAAPQQGRN